MFSRVIRMAAQPVRLRWACIALLVGAHGVAAADTYELENSHTSVIFSISHLGYS